MFLYNQTPDAHPSTAHIIRSYGSIGNYVTFLNDDMKRAGVKEKPYDSVGVIRMLQEHERNSIANKHLVWLTYYNRHGKNPFYYNWSAYFTEINKAQFLVLTRAPGFTSPYIRLISVKQDTIITAQFTDPVSRGFASSAEVLTRVKKNVNNRSFTAIPFIFIGCLYLYANNLLMSGAFQY